MVSNLNKAIIQHTEHRYETVEQVAESLTALEKLFRKTKDNRGIFTVAYKEMTLKLQSNIISQENKGGEVFNDIHWIKKYLLAFANLYRQALCGSLQTTAIPKAWQFAFEKARDDGGVISLQHLMLGINAHIAYDLPIALHQVGIDLDGEQGNKRKEDHDKVNNILKSVTNHIQNKVTSYHLSQGFNILEKLIGPIDEWVAQYYFEQQRERAWYNATHLTYLAEGKAADSFLREWFVWAIQSAEKITSFDSLKQHIDTRAFGLGKNIIRWRFPKIPGFRDDLVFDEFEQILTDEELDQLAREIEVGNNHADTTQVSDWTQII